MKPRMPLSPSRALNGRPSASFCRSEMLMKTPRERWWSPPAPTDRCAADRDAADTPGSPVRKSSKTARSESGSSKKRPADEPSSRRRRPSGSACASCSDTSSGISRSPWRCTTNAGTRTASTSAETSMSRPASIMARAAIGVVAVRNASATSRPSSPIDQPIQARAAESTKRSQSRSISVTRACDSGGLMASSNRIVPPKRTSRVTRSGWRAA